MLIDLTHKITQNISLFPGAEQPVLKRRSRVEDTGHAETLVTLSSHSGTHIDAPAHMIEGGRTLDLYPLDQYSGSCTVIDCRGLSEIGIDVLKTNIKNIERSEFVLFNSGWADKWKTPEYLKDFPVLTEEAAIFMTGFDLKALGFDYISIDPVSSTELTNHKIILGNGIMIIENTASMNDLPEGIFRLFCIPLKIDKADGSPVRVFAEI